MEWWYFASGVYFGSIVTMSVIIIVSLVRDREL